MKWLVVSSVCLGLMIAGCTKKLEEELNKTKQELAKVQADLGKCQGESSALKTENENNKRQVQELQARVTALTSERDTLAAKVAEFESKEQQAAQPAEVKKAEAKKPVTPAKPKEVTKTGVDKSIKSKFHSK